MKTINEFVNQLNSSELIKGKSIRVSTYDSSASYVNNSEYQDLVADGDSLYACVASHAEGSLDNTSQWNLLLKAPKGEKGEQGVSSAFTPIIENGTLLWSNTLGLENPEPYYIKGEQGVPGIQGEPGVNIESTHVGMDGYLYMKLTDGSIIRSGYVKGDKGEDGREVLFQQTFENPILKFWWKYSGDKVWTLSQEINLEDFVFNTVEINEAIKQLQDAVVELKDADTALNERFNTEMTELKEYIDTSIQQSINDSWEGEY